jgi:hypothetical protein
MLFATNSAVYSPPAAGVCGLLPFDSVRAWAARDRRSTSAGDIIHPGTALPQTEGTRRARTFSRHVLEMFLAMMLGMCILGAAFREFHVALFGAGFDAAWHRHTELAVFAMTFNMTVPMVALMRYRGHG